MGIEPQQETGLTQFAIELQSRFVAYVSFNRIRWTRMKSYSMYGLGGFDVLCQDHEGAREDMGYQSLTGGSDFRACR